MDTKAKGDIGEQAVVVRAMKNGWGVLRPYGDRLSYDLVLDLNGKLVKIQVKSAWFNEKTKVYNVNSRKTKTNRRIMKIERYRKGDFDFAIAYIEDIDKFYVIPDDVFMSYGGQITLQAGIKSQRRSKAEDYFEAWNLIEDWAKK